MKRMQKKHIAALLCLFTLANVNIVKAQGILSGKKIMLDAGHGGKDPGAVSKATGLLEKDLNISLTQKVANMLREMGAEVLYTRKPGNDVFIDLPARTSMANASGADLFLSIHHDSSTDPSVKGISTYYSTYRPEADTKGLYVLYKGGRYPFVREERVDGHSYVYLNYNGQVIRESLANVRVVDETPSAQAVKSGDLAKRMLEKVTSLGFATSAYKDYDLYVTRHTNMVSALIEVGYMSNKDEVLKVSNPDMENKIAEKIAESIKEFYIANGEAAPLWNGSIFRHAGSDRYETAIKISQSGWKTSEYAVIATGKDFPDALSAAPLAKTLNAPILLTYSEWLDERVAGELKKLGVKKVYIIGSEGVVSKTVENQLLEMGIKSIVRLAGNDRYATSVKIAEEIMKLRKGVSEIVVAIGNNFPDALSMAPIAASKGMPILLTYDSVLPDSVKKFIDSKDFQKSYLLGSIGLINDNVKNSLGTMIKSVERLWGSDRYGTNAAILNRFKNELNLNKVYFATSLNFPDALTGSVLAGMNGSPIILTDTAVREETKKIVETARDNIKSVNLFGSDAVVPERVIKALLGI